MENQLTVTNSELAASATAAQARAEIECAYTMAIRRPRNIGDVRVRILDACKRPVFAANAEYAVPRGGTTIRGPSIRFAETALQSLGNVRTTATVIYEDERIRKVRVSVIDLENNNAYGAEATIQKTVERKKLKAGQKPVGERVNSCGDVVYLVEATEDDISAKQGAAVSKMIRNCGLRLVPQDIIEEAMEVASQTREKNQGDPDGAKNKIIDGFSGLGVKPSELEKFLRKPLAQVVPKDSEKLREIYVSLRDGESVWSDWLEDAEVVPETLADKLKAKEKAPATGPEKKPLRFFRCPACKTVITASDRPKACHKCGSVDLDEYQTLEAARMAGNGGGSDSSQEERF